MKATHIYSTHFLALMIVIVSKSHIYYLQLDMIIVWRFPPPPPFNWIRSTYRKSVGDTGKSCIMSSMTIPIMEAMTSTKSKMFQPTVKYWNRRPIIFTRHSAQTKEIKLLNGRRKQNDFWTIGTIMRKNCWLLCVLIPDKVSDFLHVGR